MDNQAFYKTSLLYLGIPICLLLILHAGLYWMVIVYYFPLFGFGPVSSNGSKIQLLLMGFSHYKTILQAAILSSVAAILAGKVIQVLLKLKKVLLATIVTVLILVLYLLDKLLLARGIDTNYWLVYQSQLKGEIFLLGIIFFPLSLMLTCFYQKAMKQNQTKALRR